MRSSHSCLRRGSSVNQLHSSLQAFMAVACCGFWDPVTHNHMLIRCTYVACETIKCPQDPQDKGCSWGQGGPCWIRDGSPCVCLWVTACSEKDGAGLGQADCRCTAIWRGGLQLFAPNGRRVLACPKYSTHVFALEATINATFLENVMVPWCGNEC